MLQSRPCFHLENVARYVLGMEFGQDLDHGGTRQACGMQKDAFILTVPQGVGDHTESTVPACPRPSPARCNVVPESPVWRLGSAKPLKRLA